MIVSRSSMSRAAAWAPASTIIAPRTSEDAPVPRTRHASLRLSVEWPYPGIVVVRIDGEVDLATVPRLTELVRQRLKAAQLHAIIIDLSEVTFASSTVVELLLHAQRRAEQRGIPMLVVPGNGPVRRLLRMTGLEYRFTYRNTAAEAVAEAHR